jgi:CubicO group peptidase (beta-lactamase class C family)
MKSEETYPNLLNDTRGFHPDAPPIEPHVDKLLQRYLRGLQAFLRKEEVVEHAPGAAVMVRLGNRLVHLNCYGYADLESDPQKKISYDTIFDLGSLSKQFTASAVYALSFDGKVDLDASLSTFFPRFPRYADKITVRQLIHHVSALPEYTDIYVASRLADEDWYEVAMTTADNWYPGMSNRRAREITNKDVSRWVASQKLLPRAPGAEFEYSNTGYVLLAELVERVTNRRFADYLKDEVFSGIGMQNTYLFNEACAFAQDAPEVVNHAKCYNHVKGKGYVPVGYTPLNFIYGDGNVQSTIVDLAKWDAVLAQLEYDSISSSDAKIRDQFTMIRDVLWSPTELKHGKQVEYGAGWNLLSNRYEDDVLVDGQRVIKRFKSRAEYHRGVWLGWRSYIARAAKWQVPESGNDKDIDPSTWESLGIIVLANSANFNPCKVAQQIARHYWGDFKKDNIMNRFNCG